MRIDLSYQPFFKLLFFIFICIYFIKFVRSKNITNIKRSSFKIFPASSVVTGPQISLVHSQLNGSLLLQHQTLLEPLLLFLLFAVYDVLVGDPQIYLVFWLVFFRIFNIQSVVGNLQFAYLRILNETNVCRLNPVSRILFMLLLIYRL